VDNAKVAVNNQQIDFTTTSMSVDDFLNMSAKEIGQKRGKKLKLKERLALMLMKRQIKKAVKKGESVEDVVQKMNAEAESESTSNILGFLLGFFIKTNHPSSTSGKQCYHYIDFRSICVPFSDDVPFLTKEHISGKMLIKRGDFST